MYINSYCIIYPYIEHTYEPIITAFFPAPPENHPQQETKEKASQKIVFTDDPKIIVKFRKVFT